MKSQEANLAFLNDMQISVHFHKYLKSHFRRSMLKYLANRKCFNKYLIFTGESSPLNIRNSKDVQPH